MTTAKLSALAAFDQIANDLPTLMLHLGRRADKARKKIGTAELNALENLRDAMVDFWHARDARIYR